MRHVSLYRKWRPRTFDAVVGQDPVVRTLRRAIEADRVSHAYLFSGPRGTGKTSTAKVLAMSLNCEKGPTPQPDGTCESCRAIINNSSFDVLEMDAASNRGIDEIRDLRDKVNLAPAQGRMKVYIIDEVHMLTPEASNALLKMLEEPPEYFIFVLATTEKHKVLPTIISRCQSFDFRRPGVAQLSEKLCEIAEAEDIEAEPAALTLIAREGKGSFRDAESLLDQLASFTEGPITAASVRELLGSVSSEVLFETVDALYKRRAADALRVVDRLQNEGKDLSQFVSELIEHLRRLMLLPHAPEAALTEVGTEERPSLEEQAGRIPTPEVMRIIEALGDTLSRTKRGGDPKLELELTFLKLARDYVEPSVDVLLGRLEILEKIVADGAPAPPAPPQEQKGEFELAEQESGELVGEVGSKEEAEIPGEVKPQAGYSADDQEESAELTTVAVQWSWVMQELKERKQASAEAVFRMARPASFRDNVLELEFPAEHEYFLDIAGYPKHVRELQKVLEERLGMRPHLEFRVVDSHGAAPDTAANAGVLPARSQTPKEAPKIAPEGDALYREGAEGANAASGSNNNNLPDEKPAEEARADDTIQDSREVFVMARERFGIGDSSSSKRRGS
ncbi:MAG: DNA polymerase III subunit gamma/tau [Rubrobacter sp.]|nr:DNA polymerase III subunit gamma/tau [Rubrobacter sp.]